MVNGKTIAGILVGIIVIVGIYYFATIGNAVQSGNSIKILDTGSSVTENPNAIDINSNGFFPEIVEISVGETITFTNKDTKNHEIVMKNLYVNHELAENEKYEVVFNEAGTFEFYDNSNKEFTTTIVVK